MLEYLLGIPSLLLLTISVLWLSRRKSSSGAVVGSELPGPWGVPLLGHLPLIGAQPHKTFLKWGKKFGPIFAIRLGQFPAVIINDGDLIKRALHLPELSGRPHIPVYDEEMKGRQGFIWADGPRSRKLRWLILKFLKDFGYGKETMESKILEQVPGVLQVLTSQGESGKEVPVGNGTFMEPVVSYLWQLIMGTRVDRKYGNFQTFFEYAINITTISPLFALSAFIPFLGKYFPSLAGVSKRLEESEIVDKYLVKEAEEHGLSRKPGEPRDIMDLMLEEPGIGINNALFSAKELFVAGGETSNTSLEWLLYYLVKFPGIQDKAQEEIDGVIGSRQPLIRDRDALPYVEAIIQEMLRHVTIIPLGVFHSALETIQFEGYTIPKGAIVWPNLYAAHHDPSYWGDPDVFRPERFIDEGGELIRKSEYFMPFSTGKRACIGEALARNQIFLFLVSILQKYRLEARGGLPSEDGIFGFSIKIKPFFITAIRRGSD